MLRFLPVVMLIPFPILNSLNDCLEFGGRYTIQATTGLSPEAASYVEMLMGMGAATKLLNVVSLPKQLQQTVPKVANTMDGGVVAKGTANAATYAGLKLDLKTTQAANEAVDSLRATGQLPSSYITKGQAYQQGWQESKAVNNYVPGGQIGGDVFRNGEGLLPSAVGRTWYEADIGLSNSMSRGNAAQPASRLLYSSDGLLYVSPPARLQGRFTNRCGWLSYHRCIASKGVLLPKVD